MSIIDKIASYLPVISEPPSLTFQDRIKHTFIVLFLYFLLYSIPIWGIAVEISGRLRELMWVFGSSFGTLATLGIGPIVMAGIFLQLLVGGRIININLQTEEGKEKFNNYLRFLILVFIFIETSAILITGSIIPDYNLGLPTSLLYLIIFIQIAFGGFLIVLLDDYSTKYAITSGVNLFILSSISLAMVLRIFNPFPSEFHGTPTGLIFVGIQQLLEGNLNMAIGIFGIIVATFAMLIFAAYLQAARVEIPLLFARVGGRIIKFPIRVLYTSVIPIILLFAIIVQIENLYKLLTGSNEIPFFLARPNIIYNLSVYGLSYLANPFNVFHILFYLAFYVFGAAILSYFWVISSGMDARTLAQQLSGSPMFSLVVRDPRILERTLERYIRPISILSGMLVGSLAALSDILGSAIAGTSLLLLVVIAYNIYEDMVRNNVLHLFPLIGKYLTKEK